MPRETERRPLVALRIAPDDVAALDALADAAGVTRSDVVRAGVELALRGVDRGRLVAYLADVGRESTSGALTPDRRAGLGL